MYSQNSGDMIHITGATIQYIAIYCDTISKAIYCFIGLCLLSVYTGDVCLLHPVSVDVVTLEWKNQMAEVRLQHSYLSVAGFKHNTKHLNC